MPSTPIDFETLAGPLSETTPSGEDLAYDAKFVELERAATGKPERQFGEKIYPAEPPDWGAVQELALDLAGRTRDLRVAVLLARSGARQQGLAGYARGVALAQALLERQWDTVHPQLDASDGNDPTMRLSALAPLCFTDGGLGDLRAAQLGSQRGSLTVREVELGLGLAAPHGDEALPTAAGVTEALHALMAGDPGLAAAIALADRAATGIAQIVDARVRDHVLDFRPLRTLLHAVAVAAAGGVGAAAAGVASVVPAGSAAAQAAGLAVGAIASRSDAARALDRVCAWIEQNEPTSPAPLLIRRAQRLMGMSFLEIMRDMAPDSLNQIGVITGVDPGA